MKRIRDDWARFSSDDDDRADHRGDRNHEHDDRGDSRSGAPKRSAKETEQRGDQKRVSGRSTCPSGRVGAGERTAQVRRCFEFVRFRLATFRHEGILGRADDLDLVSVGVIDIERPHALQHRVHPVPHLDARFDEPMLQLVV